MALTPTGEAEKAALTPLLGTLVLHFLLFGSRACPVVCFAILCFSGLALGEAIEAGRLNQSYHLSARGESNMRTIILPLWKPHCTD